ncbi:MAG: glutathione S-transferase N-terminal domain-containing protein [Gammaproteobacteria bacterium]|nr:glutathione S-transferase N-terminal domain-containing protein [Gammaproteobacteria bacterium]MCY4217800.1 glutathione S-transferase N-terminal domain-containing protein [Gammaproteobacteria bacterium]MCY4274924.1 glutathione S-transferase N-terminal domain-containing protein [Gammaproteobacteria bacterium]
MIDLFCDSSPNGYKILILLEEIGIEYRLIPVDLSLDLTTIPRFLDISPDGKIPAIVDYETNSGGESVHLFESGAIMLYLAEKSGRYLSDNSFSRIEVLKWLFWQVSNFGPTLGQLMHFRSDAQSPQEVLDYFYSHAKRLYRFLDLELECRPYIAHEYSIADMAVYPWVAIHENQGLNIPDFPNLMRWYFDMEDRIAVQRAYDLRL